MWGRLVTSSPHCQVAVELLSRAYYQLPQLKQLIVCWPVMKQSNASRQLVTHPVPHVAFSDKLVNAGLGGELNDVAHG